MHLNLQSKLSNGFADCGLLLAASLGDVTFLNLSTETQKGLNMKCIQTSIKWHQIVQLKLSEYIRTTYELIAT